MPSPVTTEEIQKIVKVVKERAQETKSTKVIFLLDEMKPFVSLDHGENIETRFKMALRSKLTELDIHITFFGDEVEFMVPEHFLNVVRKRRGGSQIDQSKGKLQTHFTTPYIAPKEYAVVKAAVDLGHYPYLKGEPAVGKSRMSEEIAKARGQQPYRVSMDVVPDADFMIGYDRNLEVNGVSQTVFVPGPLIEAMMEGWMVICDEVDRSSDEAIRAFNMITEEGGVLVINTQNGVRQVAKHPEFRMIFSGNTWGRGDTSGAFQGTVPLNKAWLSRIGPKVPISRNLEIERELFKGRLPDGVLDYMYRENGIVRKTIDFLKDKNTEFLTLRAINRFVDAFPVLGWHLAYYIYIVTEFDEAIHPEIIRQVQNVLDVNMSPHFDLDKIEQHKMQVKNSPQNHKNRIDQGFYIDLFEPSQEKKNGKA